jgi:uracil phosphoribosyltransferase
MLVSSSQSRVLMRRDAVENIKLLAVLGSKQGLEHIHEEFPGLEVCSSWLLHGGEFLTD